MAGAGLVPNDSDHIRSMAERQWTDALRARDADRLLAMCAPEFVYMPADHPPLHSHGDFRTWFSNFPHIVEISQPVESLELHGDCAVARCSFSVTLDAGGQRVNANGKALTSLRRDPSAGWLITAVCWNFDGPPTPA